MTQGEIRKTKTGKRTFPQISSRAFEHPLDRAALEALSKVPGLDWLIKAFIGAIGERRLRLLFLASGVRVGERQFPRIKKLYDEACEILDIAEPPELFVVQELEINAAAIGVDRPIILITAPLMELLDERELQSVLGHELGHVLCGHALYTTLLLFIIRVTSLFIGIPGGIYAIMGIQLALLEWSRKAELSADRAGLLVSQDPELSYRLEMKLAGGKRVDQMDLEEFKKQATEFQEGGELIDGVHRLLLLIGQTHPFPVIRVAELEEWVKSGAYGTLLEGEYPKRQDDPERSWLKSVKEAAQGYKGSLSKSGDPLISALRDLAEGAAATGNELLERFREATGLGGDKPSDSKPDDKA